MSSPVSASPFRQSLGAIGLACFGWLMFSLCDATTKSLAADLPVIHIIAINNLIGMVLSGGWILARYGWRGFINPKWKLYVVRGIMGCTAGFLIIHSLKLIPMSDFYGIIFLNPMVVTLLAVFFLNERIGWHRIAAIIVGFIGVMIIAGPAYNDGNTGYLLALIAVVFTSGNAIIIRKIGQEKIKTHYAFFPMLTCTIITMPFMLADFSLPHDMPTIGLLALLPLMSLTGLIVFTIGLSRARDTSVVMPFHYTQMVWGALLGLIIFGDVPTLTTIAGSLVIAAAGLMVIWREHVHHRQIASNSPDLPV
jgi:S-adenosylmethionine uptake transporter